MVQIKRPLDFQAVTDHSEYMGTVRLANDPQSDLSKLPIAEKLKVRSREDIQKVYLFLATSIITEPVTELISPEVAGSVWKRVVEIADKYNQPGKFTTFAAYEWSSTPDNRNLHRNILFKDTKKVPSLPFSAIDSDQPEDLWKWMDGQRKAGNELLAISHNANLSDGVMFPLEVDSKGRPIDAAWAQSRVNNEPLAEIQQLKGASETHPALSPNDEFAGHEILEYLLGGIDRAPRLHGSYIREAYQNGLAMQDTRGYNPYKFGLVGAGDTHSTATSYTQSNYFGGHGLLDATPQARLSGEKHSGMTSDRFSTAGLGGVWAEENTREAIFAAMQRKETFGTSGVRIKVRLFGGWDFAPDVLQSKDWVKTGYANGVPMGGDLPAAKSKAPTFIVWAVKDPDDANLDRIQIVKGWTRNGQIFEKIYNVAWSNRKAQSAGRISDALVRRGRGRAPARGQYGRREERDVHQLHRGGRVEDGLDGPGLRPQPIRVLLRAGAADPDTALDDVRREKARCPAAGQRFLRRFRTGRGLRRSGIRRAMKRAKPRSLERRSPTCGKKVLIALDDAQLKDLIVGKTFKVRNTVTGQRLEILYGTNGRRLILSVDGKQPPAGDVGDVLHSGDLGSPAHYEIRGGKIVTTISGTPFEVTLYKLGDKYIAARSNEFGYANYEVE